MMFDVFSGGGMSSIDLWSMASTVITQQSGFLVFEVSLSLNACMLVVCFITVHLVVTRFFIF